MPFTLMRALGAFSSALPRSGRNCRLVTSSASALGTGSSGTPLYKPAKPTLLQITVSPSAGRIRYLIYSHGLSDTIELKSPVEVEELGGSMKSPQYLSLHPAGKVPLLVLPSGQAIPESAVIMDYLLEAFTPESPLRIRSAEGRAAAAAIIRYTDIYYATLASGAMYRAMGPEERAAGIAAIDAFLNALEQMVAGDPWLLPTPAPSIADASIFPHFAFITFMLPRFFGWRHVFGGRPRLAAWWAAILEDPAAAKVVDEITGKLEGWEKGGRWDKVGVNEQVKNASFKWAYP